MPLPPPNFKAKPSDLIGTRWVYLTTEQTGRREGIGHVVQVIDLRDGRAHMVTLYSDPFQHWWVPTESILTEFSAFEYVGTEIEVAWIGRGESIIDDRFPRTRVVCVQHIEGHLVYFEDDTTAPFLAVAWHFRPTELDEVPTMRPLLSAEDSSPISTPMYWGSRIEGNTIRNTTINNEMVNEKDEVPETKSEGSIPLNFFERLVSEDD